ncbi:MAG: hypothetical protein KC422_22355 [Trueperaceae bacterium]|nr:hypothetical protein [Trueperaceae bacterium]
MKHLLWFGPILFLAAEILLPGGNRNLTERISIIQSNRSSWAWGHVLIIVALFFLLPWLAQVYREGKKANCVIAFIGVFFSAIALMANYAIAVLQLLSFEIVMHLPETASNLLALITQPNLMITVFLPYFGFSLGFSLLALSLWQGRHNWFALFIFLSGIFLNLAGLMQIKLFFIFGSLSLILATYTLIYLLPEQTSLQGRHAKT